jgi:hypothetical protein
MRVKSLFIISLLLGLLVIPTRAQEFGYPINGEGWYFIKISVDETTDLRDQTWQVNAVRVNGARVRDWLVFQNGQESYDRLIDGRRPFELKVRYSWVGGEEYNFLIDLVNPKSGKKVEVKAAAQAPAALKGYWDPAWRNYLALSIAEEHGYRRENYPLQATIGVLSRYFHRPEEIRVVKVEIKGKDVLYTEIPCQVYNIVKWEDQALLQSEEIDEKTGRPITRYHPTTTFSLCFLASLKPYEKATYLVFYNNPSAPAPQVSTDLQVKGEGLGKTIENSFYRVVLDEKSGMITEIIEKTTHLKLEHKLETNGAVHWNPGTYSPPHPWSHASDWENPTFTEITGPVFYALTRCAPLPHLQDVLVSIDYFFFAHTPFILMESTLLVKKDLFVKALRNGEVVFNKEVFDQAAYATVKGKTRTIDFSRTRRHPEHVVTLRPDTPWIAFFSQKKKVAFASLFLEFGTTNIYGGEASCQQPYIYIQHGPWYYISRAFVYSFGSNNQSRMLPVKKGSLYLEKTAWIPFSFKKKKHLGSYLNKYYQMLKYPLAVKEIMETYPESPEGWLVPLLTEPFDEGVKKALKGRKKK